MGEKTTPTGHTQALISLKEIEEVNCPLCGALVNVDVRQGPARNRRVQDFPETLKRATIFGSDGAAMHRCRAEDRQREALRLSRFTEHSEAGADGVPHDVTDKSCAAAQ